MIVKIDNLSHDLKGIAKVNGKVTFIGNALPSEVVDIKLLDEKKNFNTGRVINYIEKSEYRVEHPCFLFEKCGGCSFSGISYSKSIEYKKMIFTQIFKRYADIDICPNVIYCDNEFYYRNKISMKVDNGKISLMEEDTNSYVSVDKCCLVNNRINDIINILSNIDLSGLEEIIIRGTLDIMVILKGEYNCNSIISLLENRVSSIIYNDDCIYGNEYISINVYKYKYAIYPNSFFQVNTNMISKLYDKVKEYAGNGKALLDLYCGAGTISIYLSDNFEYVRGIEINSDAIKGANVNKLINNIKNVSFELGNVNENININEDVVVVDPPRGGLDDKTRNLLLNSNVNRIVYVSCNPITLARDINILKEKYNINDITLFDNFPNTRHIESLMVLERK